MRLVRLVGLRFERFFFGLSRRLSGGRFGVLGDGIVVCSL